MDEENGNPPDPQIDPQLDPPASPLPDIGFDEQDLLKLINWDMPFGRFKGMPIIDMPEEYLLWFRDQGWPNGKLGHLMQIALQLKIDGLDRIVKDLRKHGPKL